MSDRVTIRTDIAWSRQLARISAGQLTLWTAAGLFMLAAHAAAGWWVVSERPRPAQDDAAPAIMIDLASVAMAPPALEEQLAEDELDSVASELLESIDSWDLAEPVEPVETVTEAEPIDEVADVSETESLAEEVPSEAAFAVAAVDPLLPEEVEPVAEPEVAAARSEMIEPEEINPLDEMVVPIPQPRPEHVPERKVAEERPKVQKKPEPKRQPAPAKQQTRAQTQAAKPAPRAAAPAKSAGSGKAVSPARWQARVMSHLERRKRYPAEARRARSQGTAQVRFTIDANGNVGAVSLTRSSGVPSLDAEVVALVRRASPIPPPPPGVGHTIVVPIRFSLR